MQQTYDCLKSALLKRYLCTESGYNKKFCDAVPFAQEDIDTFISRIETLFGKWVELAGIENGDFNSLRDLMLRDQLYRSLHSDLVTFLKERSPKSLKEVREIANRYVTAYPDRSIAKDHNSANLALKPIHANLDNKQSREYSENQRGRLQNQRSNSCGFENNRDNRHYQQNLKKQYPRDQSRWYKYSDRYSQGRHRQRGFYNDRPYNTGQNRNNYANHAHKASTVLANTGATNQNKGLTFFSGTVNEHVCTMIRDTGASCVGIRRDLLKEKDFTGETETCIMFDGTQTELELAYAYIDTPFYVGRVKAFALKNPVVGIILGNITGVKDYPLVPKTNDKRDQYDDTENKAFAVTRLTSKSDNSDEKSSNSDDNIKELTTKTSATTISDSHDKVPIDFVDITSVKFRIEQQSDDSLCSIKEKAAREDGFFVKDGLIYRRARNIKSHDQLVVPTTLRQSVLKYYHENQMAGHMGLSATKKRICSRFSWPGIMADIKQYVHSCDICQRHCNIPTPPHDIISRSACVASIEEEFCADAESSLEFKQTVQKEFPCNATINQELSLETIHDANLTVKPLKTNVSCSSVDFLGHVVSEGSIRPDKAKLQEIMDIEPPTTKKQTRRILGLMSYYRTFVPNFSTIARPLTDITRKKSSNKVQWTEECQKSLDKIKDILTTEPVLCEPDLSKPFIVQSDASAKGIGAVLMQDHNGILMPCQYASRRLLDREEKYAIIELECLAIVFALHTFAKYLLMKPFYLQSDNKPLSFLKQNKSKNARLTRWAIYIHQYTFTETYSRSSTNVVSDALSRSF